MVLFLEEPLDGGLVLDEGDDDVAVVGVLLAVDRTQSPSRIPASIIESPWTVRKKSSDSSARTKSAGSGKWSSMDSWARIGWPAVTRPTTGTTMVRFSCVWLPSSTSMARGLVGSRRMYPFSSSRVMWPWTVELELRPMASPISRTDGG